MDGRVLAWDTSRFEVVEDIPCGSKVGVGYHLARVRCPTPHPPHPPHPPKVLSTHVSMLQTLYRQVYGLAVPPTCASHSKLAGA
jgi:hypothetical protein